jgi:hypothetical protein
MTASGYLSYEYFFSTTSAKGEWTLVVEQPLSQRTFTEDSIMPKVYAANRRAGKSGNARISRPGEEER